jgi:hypothetical protein
VVAVVRDGVLWVVAVVVVGDVHTPFCEAWRC